MVSANPNKADWPVLFEAMVSVLYSAALSDVLDEMGYREQVVSPALGIRPLAADWVIAGRARTFYNEPNTDAEDPYAMAIQRGGKGALVNGYSRDTRHLRTMGFPVFCRGGTPIDTTGRTRVTALDVPLAFGQRTIQPGDIVFADADGVVIVPREAEEQVVRRALQRVKEETTVREELRAGSTIREVWDRYHIL
jgi:4-hydroxy-4-methyl-2-oxoglutarate aldolase